MIAVLTRTSLLTCALSAAALAAAVDQGEDRRAPRTELGALVQAFPKETSPSGASPSEAAPSLQKDPREGDPGYEQAQKLIKAVDACSTTPPASVGRQGSFPPTTTS